MSSKHYKLSSSKSCTRHFATEPLYLPFPLPRMLFLQIGEWQVSLLSSVLYSKVTSVRPFLPTSPKISILSCPPLFLNIYHYQTCCFIIYSIIYHEKYHAIPTFLKPSQIPHFSFEGKIYSKLQL